MSIRIVPDLPIHEYRGEGRRAEVYKLSKSNFIVRTYKNSVWQEDKELMHGERFAENFAEKYVDGDL
jgi:hypothetical protein